MKKYFGYMRRFDLDGSIRVRSEDNNTSTIIWEGPFEKSLLLTLKDAWYNVLPIKFEVDDTNTLVKVEIEKPIQDFSHEV